MIITNISGLIWFIYIIIVIIGTEVFAYMWHRYGAHDDYIPGIHDTHRIHHMNMGDDEDFVWILILIIIFEIVIGIGIITDIISGILAIVTITVSLIVFWWNWWIHNAYHCHGHWLNSYEWFRTEKLSHYIHHYHPNKNYGIASHFTDKIFGTWLGPI